MKNFELYQYPSRTQFWKKENGLFKHFAFQLVIYVTHVTSLYKTNQFGRMKYHLFKTTNKCLTNSKPYPFIGNQIFLQLKHWSHNKDFFFVNSPICRYSLVRKWIFFTKRSRWKRWSRWKGWCKWTRWKRRSRWKGWGERSRWKQWTRWTWWRERTEGGRWVKVYRNLISRIPTSFGSHYWSTFTLDHLNWWRVINGAIRSW